MVIITKVFVINENVHNSLILLVCGYLLICNMQQFSHYIKKWCLCPIFCEIAQKQQWYHMGFERVITFIMQIKY